MANAPQFTPEQTAALDKAIEHLSVPEMQSWLKRALTPVFRAHLKNGGTHKDFAPKLPERRGLSEGEKLAKRFAKLSPEDQATVKSLIGR